VRRAVLACFAAIAIAPLLVTYAHAQSGKKPPPEAVKAAQAHMTKARALYEAGNYPDAIAELETARALDPYAKDLVFNLGIVHEKALHIEEALHFYKLYLDMDIDPTERARAENIVKRLEGARVQSRAPELPGGLTAALVDVDPDPRHVQQRGGHQPGRAAASHDDVHRLV